MHIHVHIYICTLSLTKQSMQTLNLLCGKVTVLQLKLFIRCEFSIQNIVYKSTVEKLGCEIQLLNCNTAVISILLNSINIFNPYLITLDL